MEAVLDIQELVDKLLHGMLLDNVARVISKLRMINKWCRDKFKTVIGSESRTRNGVTYTATTYSADRLFGCGPYVAAGAASPEYLHRIMYGRYDYKCLDHYADIIHAHVWDGDHDNYKFTGFSLSRAEFVAINKLLGRPLSAYQLLLECDLQTGVDTYVELRFTSEHNVIVSGIGVTMQVMGRASRADVKADGFYYLIFNQLFWSPADVGNFENLPRLRRIGADFCVWRQKSRAGASLGPKYA